MQISLGRVDSVPQSWEKKLESDVWMWITNLPDIINGAFTQMENSINNMIASQSVDIGGAGAGPLAVSVLGLTADSIVEAVLISSSNAVSVVSVLPIIDGFNITFSGDPGASAIVGYTAFIAPVGV